MAEEKQDVFDSLNPLSRLEVLKDRTPEGLLKQIKEIKTPINLKTVFPYGNRVYAIIDGDVRIKRKKKGIEDGK